MIDWNRGIRVTHSGAPAVSAVVGIQRVVSWHGGALAVDENGRTTSTEWIGRIGGTTPGGYQLVENVPEEPRDHFVVYLNSRGIPFFCDDQGHGYTKQQAEKVARDFKRAVAVKVPV